MKSSVNAAVQPNPSVPKPAPPNGSKYSWNPDCATRPRLLRRIASASVGLAVLDESVPEQPVRVDPDRAAPVASLVEPLGREVVGRDDVAVGPVRVEARRAEVRHDRRELRGRQVGIEERRERDDRVLDAPLAADDVERAEAARRRVPELVEQRGVDPLGVLAMRRRIRADDLRDLDERVGRPQVDRR